MLESGASRWLEPELSAAVRMPAASAAVRAATRAVRRDIFSSWRGVGDVELCARPVPAAHACAPKSRRCESFSGGSGRQFEAAGLALDRDRVVAVSEREDDLWAALRLGAADYFTRAAGPRPRRSWPGRSCRDR